MKTFTIQYLSLSSKEAKNILNQLNKLQNKLIKDKEKAREGNLDEDKKRIIFDGSAELYNLQYLIERELKNNESNIVINANPNHLKSGFICIENNSKYPTLTTLKEILNK